MRFRFDRRFKTKTCRHCGKEFRTRYPAQKTCKRPDCVEWSADRKAEQRRRAYKKFMARKSVRDMQ